MYHLGGFLRIVLVDDVKHIFCVTSLSTSRHNLSSFSYHFPYNLSESLGQVVPGIRHGGSINCCSSRWHSYLCKSLLHYNSNNRSNNLTSSPSINRGDHINSILGRDVCNSEKGHTLGRSYGTRPENWKS